MIIKITIIVHKTCYKLIERSTQFVLRMSTPMYSFLIDGKIDQVLYVLKNQRLAYELIIRNERLNDVFAGIRRVEALFYGRCHCRHLNIIFQWSIYNILFTLQGFLSLANLFVIKSALKLTVTVFLHVFESITKSKLHLFICAFRAFLKTILLKQAAKSKI